MKELYFFNQIVFSHPIKLYSQWTVVALERVLLPLFVSIHHCRSQIDDAVQWCNCGGCCGQIECFSRYTLEHTFAGFFFLEIWLACSCSCLTFLKQKYSTLSLRSPKTQTHLRLTICQWLFNLFSRCLLAQCCRGPVGLIPAVMGQRKEGYNIWNCHFSSRVLQAAGGGLSNTQSPQRQAPGRNRPHNLLAVRQQH